MGEKLGQAAEEEGIQEQMVPMCRVGYTGAFSVAVEERPRTGGRRQ